MSNNNINSPFPSEYFNNIYYNSQFYESNNFVTYDYANQNYLSRVNIATSIANPTTFSYSSIFNSGINVNGGIISDFVDIAGNNVLFSILSLSGSVYYNSVYSQSLSGTIYNNYLNQANINNLNYLQFLSLSSNINYNYIYSQNISGTVYNNNNLINANINTLSGNIYSNFVYQGNINNLNYLNFLSLSSNINYNYIYSQNISGTVYNNNNLINTNINTLSGNIYSNFVYQGNINNLNYLQFLSLSSNINYNYIYSQSLSGIVYNNNNLINANINTLSASIYYLKTYTQSLSGNVYSIYLSKQPNITSYNNYFMGGLNLSGNLIINGFSYINSALAIYYDPMSSIQDQFNSLTVQNVLFTTLYALKKSPTFTGTILTNNITISGLFISNNDVNINGISFGAGKGDSIYNIGIGYQSLNNNNVGSTTGLNNSSVGSYSLNLNTTGNNNNSFGYSSLTKNTNGCSNNSYGVNSMVNNLLGSFNCSYGEQALNYYQNGSYNCAFGNRAGYNPNFSNGSDNIFIGHNAGINQLGEVNNSCFLGSPDTINNTYIYGETFLNSNLTISGKSIFINTSTFNNNIIVNGNTFLNSSLTISGKSIFNNTATFNNDITVNSSNLGRGKNNDINSNCFGIGCLSNTTTGATENVAIGIYALNATTTSAYNVAVGGYSNYQNTANGGYNTSIGHYSLLGNSTGAYNTAIGTGALTYYNSSNNTAIGFNAGSKNGTLVSGTNNIFIGVGSGGNDLNIDVNNTACLGSSTITTTYLYGTVNLNNNIVLQSGINYIQPTLNQLGYIYNIVNPAVFAALINLTLQNQRQIINSSLTAGTYLITGQIYMTGFGSDGGIIIIVGFSKNSTSFSDGTNTYSTGANYASLYSSLLNPYLLPITSTILSNVNSSSTWSFSFTWYVNYIASSGNTNLLYINSVGVQNNNMTRSFSTQYQITRIA